MLINLLFIVANHASLSWFSRDSARDEVRVKWWCMGKESEERQGQEMGDANVPPERILGQLFLEKLNSAHVCLLSPTFRASDI